MGLDIRGYSKVKLIEGSDDESIECKYEWADELSGGSWDVCTIPYLNEDFPKHSEDLVEGVYTFEDHAEGGSRSYSGWSNFREVLAKNVGYEPITLDEVPDDWDEYTKRSFLLNPHQSRVFNVKEGPLFELINFSDCEGVINTTTCKKIYNDLELVDHLDLEQRDQELLYKLLEAFKLGSDDGFVTFG